MNKIKHLIALAAVLMDEPSAQHWGYDLQTRAGMRSGVLYPMLKRLLAEGWLEDGWEDPSVTAAEGRPPRRYYKLTKTGMRELGALAAQAPVKAPLVRRRLQLGEGFAG